MEVRRGDGSVISVEVAGEQGAAPVLLCHGLADSRLSARLFTQAARELGLCIMTPDRPGTGGTDPRRLGRLADWAEDAALVLDGVRAESAALLGISAGGPFAAGVRGADSRPDPQPHAGLPARPAGVVYPRDGARGTAVFGGGQARSGVRRLVSRPPGRGGARPPRAPPRAPPARRSPRLFLRLAASELPGIDRRAIEQPGMRDAFLAGYAEAFRRGSRWVAQDLRVLTRPWAFQLGSITVPTSIHHGDADTTVPPRHARLYAEAIPGAQLQLYPGHGHFSILAAAWEMLAPLAR